MVFDIRHYVEFDPKGRANCPSCEAAGKTNKKTLSLVPGTDGAYKCFRGCSPDDIREALGQPKDQVIPREIATATTPARGYQVPPKKVIDQMNLLLKADCIARQWLNQRGISDEMIRHYRLGLCRAMAGQTKLTAIGIPVPNDDRTQYWLKKRVAPWLEESDRPPGYKPWVQAGIPARVWFAYCPEGAQETWLCEGEWDAMMLGWLCNRLATKVAVASFTCGAGNVPPQPELDKLPGQVRIFYDRNDEPLKNGTRPGEVGAEKVYRALGERAAIALVPMPDNCKIKGWDVSDAIRAGYGLDHFRAAAAVAERPSEAVKPKGNSLRSKLSLIDSLVEQTPDYPTWLVPDLLPANEMVLLAAGPRSGKSLFSMLLARCVASGENFLDRPTTQGAVIYVACEDSPVKIKQRYIAQNWPAGLPVFLLDKFKLSQLDELEELIDEHDCRLLILDTLSRIRDDMVNESSAEMSRILEPLQELAVKKECCILLVHHTGKVKATDAETLEIFEHIRGSSAIRATCRGTMVLATDKDCYRLYSENGYGKHDLRLRLDTETLEWKLIGRWSEKVSTTQKDQALDYLNMVGQATLEQIWEHVQFPKASLYKALDRLAQEGMITKRGSRRQILYTRVIDTIRQSTTLSNSENDCPVSDTGAIRQKEKNLSSSLEVDSGQLDRQYSPAGDDVHFSPDVHFSAYKGNESNCLMNSQDVDGEDVSAFRQASRHGDSDAVCLEAPEGYLFPATSLVLVFQGDKWVKGVYIRPDGKGLISNLTGKIHNSHQVMVRRKKIRVSEPDIRLVVEGEGDA